MQIKKILFLLAIILLCPLVNGHIGGGIRICTQIGWTYLLVDSNHYYYSWDTEIDQYSIYFIGNSYSEKEISKTINRINNIFEDENRYKNECKKSAKKNGYSTIGRIAEYMSYELNKVFKNRIEFNYFDKKSRDSFTDLSKGDIIKEYKYEGKGYILNKDTIDLKKYFLIKHFW